MRISKNCIVMQSVVMISVFSLSYGVNGVPEDYYNGLLLLNDSLQLVSNKIEYPGLIRDTNTTLSFGFLTQPISEYSPPDTVYPYLVTPHATLRWSDLYGWMETKTRFGKFGGWLGNIDAYDNKEKGSLLSRAQQLATASGALWFSPNQGSWFKGVSINVNGQYNGSAFHSVNSSSYSSTIQDLDRNYESMGINTRALFKLSDKYNLKCGLNGSYSNNGNSDFRKSVYYGNTSYSISRQLSKYRQGSITAGIVDAKGRQLGLIISASINNSGEYYSTPSYTESPSYNSGNLVAELYYSGNKELAYLKHRVYLGIQAYGGVRLPFSSEKSVHFKDIFDRAGSAQQTIFGSLSLPVLADINLFNTPIYALFRITPSVYGDLFFKGRNETDRYFSMNLNEIALGLRGRIGNRLDFFLIPSLKSNVFTTGLEIRYLLKRKALFVLHD